MAIPGANMRSAAIVFTALGLAQRAASLLLLPILTRAMGPSEFGTASLVVTTCSLTGAILGGPVEQAVFRWSALQREDGPSLLLASRLWILTIAPLSIVGLAGVVYFLHLNALGVSAEYWAVELVAIAFGLFGTYYSLPLLRARRSLGRFVAIAASSVAILVSGKIVFVAVLQLGAMGWVLSDMAASALTLTLALWLTPRSQSAKRPSFRVLANFALPLVPHTISFWAVASLSVPLVAIVLNFDDVGLFSVSLSAASIGILILAEINRAAAPDYARSTLPGPDRTLARPFRFQLWALAAVPVLVAVAAYPYGHWYLSAQFESAATVTAVLSFISLGYGLYLISINFLILTAGITKWSWIASVSGTAIGSILILIFGSSGGLLWVAGFTAVGYGVMAMVAYVLIRAFRIPVSFRHAGISLWTLPLSFVSVSIAVLGSSLSPNPVCWALISAISAILLVALLPRRPRQRPPRLLLGAEPS